MNKEELNKHYKTLYQIVKRDKDEVERELQEYKLLNAIQQDIIDSQNKRITDLETTLKEKLQNMEEE